MEVQAICGIIGAGAVSADKIIPNVPNEAIESLSRCILPSIQAYFENDEGQQAYAEWQAEKENVDTEKTER